MSSFPSTNNFSSAREYYVQLSSLCQHLHLSKNLFAIVPQLIIYLICNFCIKKDKDRIFLKFQFQLFLSSERGNQGMISLFLIFYSFFFLLSCKYLSINAICKHGFSDLQFVKIPSPNSIQFRTEEVSGTRENNLTGEK